MFTSKLKVLSSHGTQYIKNLDAMELTAAFRGHAMLTAGLSAEELAAASDMCPTGAISANPFTLDMGRCLFCGECAWRFPANIAFTSNHKSATNIRKNLVIEVGENRDIEFDDRTVRDDIRRLFGRALKLREVSAGGDASSEMELNASMNVNFDFARYGVEFVASPRHADGLVITGPITRNMAAALEICYNALPEPRIIILTGTDAISGGLFAQSPEIDRSFLERHDVDLYVPGNPVHPLTFIDGVRHLVQRLK